MSIFSLKPPIEIDSKLIKKVNYGGIKGRIVTIKSEKQPNKDIVLLSGHHSSHERMYSIGDYLSQFGTVHMIDLPGFGGMNSFESVGKKTSFEAYAEYIYMVLKSRKLHKNTTVIAISISTEYMTRMFQMFPESTKWFKRYIAFVGFGSAKDFNIGLFFRVVYRVIITIGATSAGAKFIKAVFLNRVSLVPLMTSFSYFKRKMQNEDPEQQRKNIEMEKHLWHVNDIRSQSITAKIAFKIDLNDLQKEKIGIKCHNIVAENDQYFDSDQVRKTFQGLYNEYEEHQLSLGVHMPSMVSDKSEIAKVFPDDFEKVISR